MLYNYQFQSRVKPVNNLESYFKCEGLDGLYILSHMEKKAKLQKKNKVKKIKSYLIRKFNKFLWHITTE